MLSITLVCLFVVFCRASDYYSSSLDSSKVPIYAFAICRDGRRTPINTFPNDQYRNSPYSPYGLAEPTNDGLLRMFEVGEYLKYRYGKSLFDDIQQPQGIYAQSTDYDRTKVSLLALLSGAFPPAGTPFDWNSCLNWNPLPIHYLPVSQDDVLIVREACPRYYEAVTEVLALSEIIGYLSGNRTLLDSLASFTGISIRDPFDVEFIYDILRAQSFNLGYRLSSDAQRFYPDTLLALVRLAFDIISYTPELKQIRAGPLIQIMADLFTAKSAGTFTPSDQRISIYVGHDNSITPILDAFGVRDEYLVEEGDLFLFELVRNRNSNAYEVQLLARRGNDKRNEVVSVPLPGCATSCSLDQFISLSNPFIRRDRTVLCTLKISNFVPPSSSAPIHNF